MLRAVLFLLSISFSNLLAAETEKISVTTPPPETVKRLTLDPFYEKYFSANGFPIVSSKKVSDFALLEAAYLIDRMLGHRPDILEAITEAKVRLAIMAPDEFTTAIPEHSDHEPKEYWDKRARGLGSTPKRPAVSCGEENLLAYEGDPYARENIFIHEFAHTIHQQGLSATDPTFQERLDKTFARAKLEGLWKSKYAGTNPSEYWAEGVQSWFDTNRENDHDHNHVNTREELKAYDPRLAKLVEEVFGDGDWRYRKPKDRESPGHLAGYDPAMAPVFEWPAELLAAYEAIQKGTNLDKLAPLPLANLDEGSLKSPQSPEETKIRIDNQTTETVKIFWIDFSGKRKEYHQTDPERSFHQNTFAGHLWLVTDPEEKPLALFAAGKEPGLGVVRKKTSPSKGAP